MNINPLNILLIEDEIAYADWIDAILANDEFPAVEIRHVKRLQEAINCLSQSNFDAILLDLSLPDSQGIESIVQIKHKTLHLPIIVLTCLNDQNIAIAALRQGVQDYLIKGKFTGELLIRSIRYAIERKRTEVTLRQQALMKTMLDRIRQSLDLKQILSNTVVEVRQFLQTDRVAIYRCQTDSSGEIIAQSVLDNQEKSTTLEDLNFDQLSFLLDRSTNIQAIEDVITATQKDICTLAEHQIRSILTLAIWQSPIIEHSLDHSDDTSEISDFCALPKYLISEPTQQNLPHKHSKQSTQDQLWGMLVAHNCHTPRKWQDWEIEFLEQLTTQVTIAIQQSELYRQLKSANRELERLAILDGLTGVANRRYFDRVLNHEWQRLAREQKPLSLILCDIDYFKLYNDTYGHPAGDHALQTVAQVMQTAIRRPADLVARYGGEEFALILPDTNNQGALCVANLVRHNLAQLELVHQKSAVSKHITLSIGIVTQIPKHNLSPSSLVDRADELLYQAKRQGRDRVMVEKHLSSKD